MIRLNREDTTAECLADGLIP